MFVISNADQKLDIPTATNSTTDHEKQRMFTFHTRDNVLLHCLITFSELATLPGF